MTMTMTKTTSKVKAALLLMMLTMVAVTPLQAADDAPAASPEPVTFSEAETRLWMTDQLGSIDKTMKLNYAFEKSGTLEAGFTDTVKFAVQKINADGSKAATVEFFSGARNFPVPPVDSTTVNPILMVYFQGDVYEMNRLTDEDGAARERWRYFQRRIKLALAESAAVKPTSFEFNGRQWQGYEISFDPYADDPHKESLKAFSAKHYSVIVSDQLPGYLYRIETHVPGPKAGEFLVREVLQLASIDS